MKKTVELDLPEEFLALCQRDGVEPERFLRGFIADLCNLTNLQSSPRTDGYNSNGSDERMIAKDYYYRVGYPYWNKDPVEWEQIS